MVHVQRTSHSDVAAGPRSQLGRRLDLLFRRRRRLQAREGIGSERPDDVRVVEADVVALRAQRDDLARRLIRELHNLNVVADGANEKKAPMLRWASGTPQCACTRSLSW